MRHKCRYGGSNNSIHYPRAVLIGIIEITLRECRLGGYKLSDHHSHSVYNHFIGWSRNYATRVSLIGTLADYTTISYDSKLSDANVGYVDYALAGYHTRWLQDCKIEERSTYKYVCTYKVAHALFSSSVGQYVWEKMSILDECARGTRWLYASDERYVVYQMSVHSCTRSAYKYIYAILT